MTKNKNNPNADEGLPPAKRQKTIDGSNVHITEEMLRIMLADDQYIGNYQSLNAENLATIKQSQFFSISQNDFLQTLVADDNLKQNIKLCFLGALFFEDISLINILMHDFDKLSEFDKQQVVKYAEHVANLRQTNTSVSNYNKVTGYLVPQRNYKTSLDVFPQPRNLNPNNFNLQDIIASYSLSYDNKYQYFQNYQQNYNICMVKLSHVLNENQYFFSNMRNFIRLYPHLALIAVEKTYYEKDKKIFNQLLKKGYITNNTSHIIYPFSDKFHSELCRTDKEYLDYLMSGKFLKLTFNQVLILSDHLGSEDKIIELFKMNNQLNLQNFDLPSHNLKSYLNYLLIAKTINQNIPEFINLRIYFNNIVSKILINYKNFLNEEESKILIQVILDNFQHLSPINKAKLYYLNPNAIDFGNLSDAQNLDFTETIFTKEELESLPENLKKNPSLNNSVWHHTPILCLNKLPLNFVTHTLKHVFSIYHSLLAANAHLLNINNRELHQVTALIFYTRGVQEIRQVCENLQNSSLNQVLVPMLRQFIFEHSDNLTIEEMKSISKAPNDKIIKNFINSIGLLINKSEIQVSELSMIHLNIFKTTYPHNVSSNNLRELIIESVLKQPEELIKFFEKSLDSSRSNITYESFIIECFEMANKNNDISAIQSLNTFFNRFMLKDYSLKVKLSKYRSSIPTYIIGDCAVSERRFIVQNVKQTLNRLIIKISEGKISEANAVKKFEEKFKLLFENCLFIEMFKCTDMQEFYVRNTSFYNAIETMMRKYKSPLFGKTQPLIQPRINHTTDWTRLVCKHEPNNQNAFRNLLMNRIGLQEPEVINKIIDMAK